MKTKVFTSIGVMGALGLLAAIPAYALGLGKIELSSALNEPFKAEIPVIAASGDEAETLQVRLASNAEFERAGLIKDATINQLRFEVTQKGGTAVIIVTSQQPIKEPLLDFLLLAKSSNGQLIREYTVLLDPPKHIFKAPQPSAKVVPSPSISQPRQVSSQARVTTSNTSYQPPSLAGTASYGPTSRTDTLWDIALKTRPSRDVSVHQMMLALVEQNKSAFINQNINGLKSGYTLAIPSDQTLRKLSKQQAISAVKQQNNAWKNRNKTQQPESASAVSATTMTTQAQVKTTEDANAADSAATIAGSEMEAETSARLQLLGSNDDNLLSENDSAAFGNKKIKELSDQLTMAQEVIEGQQQENIDIKSRMAAMEEQIQTLRKLVALQDPDLARLQSKLEQDASEAEEFAASLAANLDDKSEADLASEETDAIVDQSAGLEELEAAAISEADVIDEDSNELIAEKISQGDEAVVEMTMEDEPVPVAMTLLQKVQAFLTQYKLQALLGVLGLLLALFFLGRKRAEDERKVSWDEAVDTIKETKTPVTPAVAAPAVAVVADETLKPDPVKTVDDLIKDADVYVSYGDFGKAGLVLEEAYDEAPSNMAVIKKLLFTHYKQGKTVAFVELAREYTVERDSMEWAEVADWGRELDTENLLFAEPVIDATPIEKDMVSEESQAEDNTDNDLLDFNLASEDAEALEINLADVEDVAEEIASDPNIDSDELTELSLSSELDDNSLEFNGLDTITDTELEAATAALSDDDDNTDLEFDLSDFDQVDEAETKLDLATAYIEMGDPEGAKTIIEEIINEGSEDQQVRAKALLNDMS